MHRTLALRIFVYHAVSGDKYNRPPRISVQVSDPILSYPPAYMFLAFILVYHLFPTQMQLLAPNSERHPIHPNPYIFIQLLRHRLRFSPPHPRHTPNLPPPHPRQLTRTTNTLPTRPKPHSIPFPNPRRCTRSP